MNTIELETKPLQDRLLTKRELAAVLRITPRTVELHLLRGLPAYRIGTRRTRFKLDEVLKWYQTNQEAA